MGLLRAALATLLRYREARESTSGECDASATDADVGDLERLAATGRLDLALAALDEKLATDAASVPLRLARIAMLRRWGREQEAALAVAGLDSPAHADPTLLRARAWAAIRAGRMEAAVADLERVVAVDDDVDAAIDLARALQALGQHDAAAARLDAAFARAPSNPALMVLAGSNDLARGRVHEAESWFRRAIDVAPSHARAHGHLGVALAALDREREALEAFAEARRHASEDEIGTVLANIAIGHCELAEVARGIDELATSLPQYPDPNGYHKLGTALLSKGHLCEGWRMYEHRWLVEPLSTMRADYGVPPWRGQPLEGRTILVRAEQGLGDVFQFIRYLPLLKARGARVLFQPLLGIEDIARRFQGVDHVLLEGERMPQLDYYANLMSLPHAFGTTLATIPATNPYFSPEPATRTKWAARFGTHDRPRVALCWAGRPEHRRDRHRSIALELFSPVLAIPDIAFVSVQKGRAAVQADAVAKEVDWRNIGAQLDTLDDAAAVLAEVDLLVCVDTALAHLAAAMGRPVWMLVTTPAEFRWLEEREDTPWYPTMRLFRQRTARQWEPEIARIAAELVAWRDAWRPAVPVQIGGPSPRSETEPLPRPLPGVAVAADTRWGFIRFDPGERPVGESLESYGEWAQRRLELALRFAQSGATVVEAGGGAGAHTLALARAVGPSGLVLAYESRLSQRRLLAANLAAHAMKQVTVMSRELGKPPAGFDAGHESLDSLALARLEGLVVHERADVVAILAGGEATLWRCRPWLLLASDDDATLDQVRELVREAGYCAWHVDAPLDPPDNYYRADATRFGGAVSHALWALPEEADFRRELPGAISWP